MFITWFILLVSLAITSMASSLPAVPGAIGGKLSTGR
jgi:urea transporter